MRKTFGAVAAIIAAVFMLAPATGAQDAFDCDIYVTPVISADGSVTQGESLSVSGSGFPAGADVIIAVNGIEVGTAVADASGSFSTDVTVAGDTPVGDATVVATSDACDSVASTTIEVLPLDGVDGIDDLDDLDVLDDVLAAGGTAATPTAATPTAAKPTASVASATQTPSSSLARTGNNSGPMVALAVGLIGLGAIALLAARRRSSDIT